MYMDNNWNPVQGEELAGFLEQINPIGDKYSVSPQTTEVGRYLCAQATRRQNPHGY